MKAKKRLFIGLQAAGLILVIMMVALFLYLAFFDIEFAGGLAVILPPVVGVATLLFFLFLAAGIGGLVLSVIREDAISVLEFPTRVAIAALFPVTIYLGRIFRVSRERIQRSFIEVNNQLSRAQKISVSPGDLLILAPHCLQKVDCAHKITMNIDNCQRCGRCSIDQLIELRDELGVKVQVVTGGTLARKVLIENRPEAVVAIACERDLVSGLLDVFPLPARGIVNIRPHGPCFNTDVDTEAVRRAVVNFIE